MVELVHLPHGLRPVLRPDGVVQLGSPPGRCVEVPGLTREQVQYLTDLMGPVSERSDRVAMQRAGLDEPGRQRLLARLRELDAVMDVSDPPDARAMSTGRRERLRAAVTTLQANGVTGGWQRVRARDAATVVVDTGPSWCGSASVQEVAASLGGVMREGGVGQLVTGRAAARWWHDLGDTAAPELATLVVSVHSVRTDAVALRPLVEAGVPHLPVVVTPSWVSIGPVVRPGQACCECLVHHEVPAEQVAAEWEASEAAGPDSTAATVPRTPADLVDWAIRWGARTALWVVDGLAGVGGIGEQTTRVTVSSHSPMPRVEQFGRHPDCWCSRDGRAGRPATGGDG